MRTIVHFDADAFFASVEHPLVLFVESAREYYNLSRLLSAKAESASEDEGAVAD